MFEWLKDKFGKGKDEENAKDKSLKDEKGVEDEPTVSNESAADTPPIEEDTSIEDDSKNSQSSDEAHEDRVEELSSEEMTMSDDTKEIVDETQVKASKETLEISSEIIEQEQERNSPSEVVQPEATDLEEDIPSDEEIHEEAIKSEFQKEDAIQEVDRAENGTEEVQVKKSFFQRLKEGLTKTRDDMSYKINDVLGNYVKIDDDLLEELEYILISADIGMETTMKLIDRLRNRIREDQVKDPKAVIPLLSEEMEELLNESNLSTKLDIDPAPAVILVVGVNGVGKTTTIGKLAHQLRSEGKQVILAAADTFRAAAIEQLQTWGQRTDTPVIAHREGADPAAVVYDAIQATKARGADVLICDTAGRLHNKANLMKELEKIHRVISKEFPEAKREQLLVLDATTGQNALIQAKTFKEVTELTGIVLTKLDGTAKGGVILPLQTELKIPIKYVGVGESIDDLQPFYSKDFSKALLGLDK